MSTAKLIELQPGQQAWLEISCEGGAWLARDGLATYSLRTGDDLVAALRGCQDRQRPVKPAGALVQVERIQNGGWLLCFDDTRRVVHDDDRTPDRVLDDIRRSQTQGVSLLERFEAAVYSGDESDAFCVPGLEQPVTRRQLRGVAQGTRWLLRAAQMVSLSPKPQGPHE